MEQEIKKSIISTIVFFDMFDFPLTSLELWKYAGVRCGLRDVEDILKRGGFRAKIKEKNGFYFLEGREEIVEIRKGRYVVADNKYKIAARIAKLFKIIPWIRMIGIGNTMGANNFKSDSDIDLFIITKSNRIWLTRFFCVLVLMILGRRPTKKRVKNKICLSFFVTEDKMGLKDLRIGGDKDVYFMYWLAGLVTVFDVKNTYKEFIGSNSWIAELLPNWFEEEGVGILTPQKNNLKLYGYYEYVMDVLFGWANDPIKMIQLKKMSGNLKRIMNKDTRVVVNDYTLKLFSNDRREDYNNGHRKLLREVYGLE